MNTPKPPSFEQNPYQATAIQDLSNPSDEMEVELASPWARIGAVIINIIIVFIAVLPVFFAIVPALINRSPKGIIAAFSAGGGITILLLLGLAIWQMAWMSQRGQSIGKRLLGIKVIGLEGQNPGFVGTVLMREIVFGFLINAVIFVIVFILGLSYSLTGNTGALIGQKPLISFLSYIPYIICLIMLFRPRALRRTLQDYLAKTMVIKA